MVPSSLALIACWIFMVSSGLLIAEVNLNEMFRTGKPGLSLLSMTKTYLGDIGSKTAGFAYIFIHYALLVAYIAQGGDVLSGIFGVENPTVGAIFFTVVFGGCIALGSDAFVEAANNAMVVGVLFSFVTLLAAAGNSVQISNLFHSDWSAVVPSIPTMFVALVFHNIVSVIVSQL